MKEVNEQTMSLYIQALEKAIVHSLDLHMPDSAISECEKALSILAKKSISLTLSRPCFAMIYANMGIAYLHKCRDENTPSKKENFYNQATKYLNKGIKLWRKQNDENNILIMQLHLAELSLMMDGNVTKYIRKSKSIAKKIKNIESKRTQEIYAATLMSIVRCFCTSAELNNCGLSYDKCIRYLSEVKVVYETYYPNNPIKQLELWSLYGLLEATCTIEVKENQENILLFENILEQYREHIAKDFREGQFEQYAIDIQNAIGVLSYRVGAHFDQLNNYEKSSLYYNKAIKYYNDAIFSLKKICAYGSENVLNILLNIAVVRLNIYRFEKNQSYLIDNIKDLQNALGDFAPLFPNSLLIADTFIDLGRTYYVSQQYEQALGCYENAEQIIKKNSDIVESATSIYWLCKNYADLCIAIHDYNKAKCYIDHAIEILIDSGYEADAEEVLELNEKLKKC